jgi:neutral ceramidase
VAVETGDYMGGELFAGVGRVDISPPVGVDLVGTSLRSQPSNGVYMPLVATCLVLSTGDQKLAVFDSDLLSIPNPTARRIRERCGLVLGAPHHHVLLNCSHTHGAPMTSLDKPKIGGDQETVREEEERYVANLEHQLVGAVRLAVSNLTPARIAAGSGKSDISVNRREIRSDGTVVIGRNFEAPCDDEVGVIRVDTEDGRPLAAIANFAAHPGVLSPAVSRLISPDFPGPMRSLVEEITGAKCLFLQGAAGDITTLESMTTETKIVERVGKQLACEVARVYFGLRPHPVEERPKEVTSIAPVLTYEEVPVEVPPITRFEVRSREVLLPLKSFPSFATARENREALEAKVVELRSRGASNDETNPVIYHWLAARRLEDLLQEGDSDPSIPAEVQVIRINDIALVAFPGEAFTEMSLSIKRSSPVNHTYVAGYSNGAIGYIPVREAYRFGGYELENAHKGYAVPSALQEGSAERLVDVALELLDELA